MFDSFKNYKIKDYDFKLILFVISITVIGLLVVNSAAPDLTKKQTLGFLAGVVIMIILSLVDYHFWLKFFYLIYAVNLALLIAVIVKGQTSGGAQRWFSLFGVRYQPSETAKIMLILFFAQFIMKFKDRINEWYMIIIMAALSLPPVVLILKQPDLSTTIVLSLIICSLLYFGELSYKYIIAFLVIVIPAAVILFMLLIQPNSILVEKGLLEQYHQTRVLAWMHPDEYELEEAFQQQNSIMAIGSGQLTGKGLNNTGINSVKNGNFISEPQTDFIFTIVGEELGFVGSSLVIILLILITIECFWIAFRASDISGRIIAGGMGAYVGFQSTINICVTTGIIPNTGLPLPFVSYGLTSLLCLYIGMGFVLNVRLQRARKYNND